jgi:spore coat polysaccharide biosynthesis protein SpsF
MIVAIIQARMTSTRLPGKVLAEIGGRPALRLMLDRLAASRRLDRIVVATTVNASDDPVVALCRELGIASFRGSEADVLSRMLAAADAHQAQGIVRLTADCPIIDPAVLDEAVALFAGGNYDYVSNARMRTYPDGLDVEVLGREALARADREARHPALREHVTPYINGRRPEWGWGDFRLGDLCFAADFSHVRWTLDRPDDLARLRRLVSLLPEGFGWLQALSVATREPALLGLPRA